jgi:hypothetical protein
VKCSIFFQFDWDLHRLNFDESDYICRAWRSWPGEENGQEAARRRSWVIEEEQMDAKDEIQVCQGKWLFMM